MTDDEETIKHDHYTIVEPGSRIDALHARSIIEDIVVAARGDKKDGKWTAGFTLPIPYEPREEQAIRLAVLAVAHMAEFMQDLHAAVKREAKAIDAARPRKWWQG